MKQNKSKNESERLIMNSKIEKRAKERKQTFAEIIKEYGMTDEQVAFLQQFSKERSCRAYEKVAESKIGSAELATDWKYNGYYDSGYRGAEHCSAGHALRYVHIAKNVKTGEEIKFGIKCVSDFFSITPVQLKFIQNGFAEANREIEDSINSYIKAGGDFDVYNKSVDDIASKLKAVIEYDANLLMRHDSYADAFLETMKVAEMQQFVDLKLPLPNSFKWTISSAYRRMTYRKEAEKKLHDELKEILEYDSNLLMNHNSNDEALELEEIQQIADSDLPLSDNIKSAISSAYRQMECRKTEASDNASETTEEVTAPLTKEEQLRTGAEKILPYLEKNHSNLYNIVKNIVKRAERGTASARQIDYALALVKFDYEAMDNRIIEIGDNVKPNMRIIYKSLLDNYRVHGLTENQMKLFDKCLL